ncbi:MAG: hypothetical protein JXA22_02735 [Candidatus Thermoplasmatota archaeon]|nr:hypothetical protein [Candidatus Thermoplasmatota archaeon]
MRGNVTIVLLMAAAVLFIPLSNGAAGPMFGEGVFAGSSPYSIGPYDDMLTVIEDDIYISRYFAVMGDLTLNSFTTDADWLSTSNTAPLVLDRTDLECQWSFDQGDASDSSGNGHDGIVHGAVATSGPFGIGTAMSFDGDDHIDVPHTAALNITSEITVEAWIYPTFTDTGEHMIISKGGSWGDDDPQDYEITMDKDRPLFQIKIPFSNDWYGAAPMDPIVKNVWHHLAGVYDGSRFLIYIDGINQTVLYNGWDSSYKGSVYSGGLPTSSHNISIGRRAPASWGSLFFKGSIDEVRIFDKALTPDDILEHATRPGTRTITITGTPDNRDVGEYDVALNITDGLGNYAEREFTLTVMNDPPEILTENVLSVHQDEEYSVDYDADDEGLGITQWQLITEASWLKMEPGSGLLHGTPTNANVGTHHVKVTFNDGKGGQASDEFNLEVLDINDLPFITTTELPDAVEDEFYSFQLQGGDPDGEELTWSWQTDVKWLEDGIGSYLKGTPTNDDVGPCNITVRAQDPRGLFVTSIFEFSVINVNDRPEWVDVPENITIKEGEIFVFDVNATDVDVGDELIYIVDSYPPTNISINHTTGQMEWLASRDPFSWIPELDEDHYILKVVIDVTDGKDPIDHHFEINMTPIVPPTTTLADPQDEMVIIGNSTELIWETENPEMLELVHRVYLSKVKNQVVLLNDDVMTEVVGNTLEVRDLDPGNTYYWTVIPIGGSWPGLCLNDTFSFFVDTPPASQLSSPADGSRISAFGAQLSWQGSDADGHPVVFDLFLGTSLEEVTSLSGGVMLEHMLSNTSYRLGNLIPGTTYFWTIVPSDGYMNGACENGVLSFRTNTPPQLMPLYNLQVEVGKELLVDIEGVDADEGDLGNLTFSFETSLEGMSIHASSGLLKWTPYENQVGNATVVVRLSDGIDHTNISINILVLEPPKDNGEEGSFSVLLIILVVLLVLIIMVVLIIILLMRKDRGETRKEVEEGTASEPSGVDDGQEQEITDEDTLVQDPSESPQGPEATPPEEGTIPRNPAEGP